MLVPKECIHHSCKSIIYVPKHLLHQLLMCENCVETKTKQHENAFN